MRFLVPLLFILATGCSGLFLHPDKVNYFPKAKDFVVYDEGFIPASKGEKLHYWRIPAQKNKELFKDPKGIVIQVHGNAQNLTSHVRGLGWITEEGYDLVVFDYRGFGQSSGEASLQGAYADVQTSLDFVFEKLNPKGLPVIFYGQSLGGTLLLKAFSSSPGRWKPRVLVIESSFKDYQDIAREKLTYSWITWPIQWMAYLVIPGRYSLEDEELKTIAPVPAYLFYSERDPIVPMHHGRKIFDGLGEPKQFITFPQGGHINAMWIQEGKYRKFLLEEFDKALKNN
jgi:uncharacterized protein